MNHLPSVLAAAVLGCAALVLPVYLDPAVPEARAEFLPIMAATVEHMKFYSLGLLALIGLGLGLLTRTPVLLVGFATVLALPIWSAIDVAMGSEGHNLLGIEWWLYVSYGLYGVLGAFIGRMCRRWIVRCRARGSIDANAPGGRDVILEP